MSTSNNTVIEPSNLGEVNIIQSLFYYNGDLIFVGDHNSQLHLFYAVDGGDVFAAFPITEEQWFALKNGDIGIANLFKNGSTVTFDGPSFVIIQSEPLADKDVRNNLTHFAGNYDIPGQVESRLDLMGHRV